MVGAASGLRHATSGSSGVRVGAGDRQGCLSFALSREFTSQFVSHSHLHHPFLAPSVSEIFERAPLRSMSYSNLRCD